jgi:hypothetical protein
MNAPPDLCALLNDGRDRPISNLQDVLKPRKRIFVCGLCMDVYVLHTCVNAAAFGFAGKTFMVADACRAAHIHGFGTFGTGFLYDPSEVKQKMTDISLRFSSVAGLLGSTKRPPRVELSLAADDGMVFPSSLASFGLVETAKFQLTVDAPAGQYTLALEGLFSGISHLFSSGGSITPVSPLPPGWPGAPAAATQLCWANPPAKTPTATSSALLAANASPELRFIAYGGFLMLNDTSAIVAVQSISAPTGDRPVLNFETPRKWRPLFVDG